MAANNIQDSELLVHKIGQRISDCMKQTDYYIGYAPYKFQFVIEEFSGETIFSEKITPIEQAIVGILSIDNSASFERIGNILGFNVLQDKAECNILSNSLKALHRHNVIEGDHTMYCLTSTGKIFASEGKRPEQETYGFTLWYNKNHPEVTSLNECLDADNIMEEDATNDYTEPVNLDLIRSIATIQAPKVHNPGDERQLINAKLIKSSTYSYQLYVCFVKNVLTSEVRALVYDESQDLILEELSSLVDNNEHLKASLFDSIVESVFIPEEVELTNIEQGYNTDDNIIEVEVSDKNGIQKLHKRALYDEIGFEKELNQIFSMDKPNEIWLISPWIGYFFVQCRVPMIESALKEGTKVFIAYSKKDPRDKNRADMVNPQAYAEIVRLSETYNDFYCVELPKIFHTKNVLEIKNNQVIMFSGSFNILSFAINESHKIIRGEQMAFVNPQTAKTEYRSYIDTFASVYIDTYKNKLSANSLSAKDLTDCKLRYFSTTSSISDDVDDILDAIDNKLIDNQKIDWSNKINALHKKAAPLFARGIITLQDKKTFRTELAALEESGKLLDLDDELLNNLHTLQEHIEHLKVRKKAEQIFEGDNKEDYSNEIQTLLEKKGSGVITPDNVISARSIIRNHKLSNTHQVVRYIVSLNLMQQAIRKKAENAISYSDLLSAVFTLIERTDNKIPDLSIFIIGDVTYIDICGIQISFYKVPHTDKTKSIIDARRNKVEENKRLNLHFYSNELFNLVFNRE